MKDKFVMLLYEMDSIDVKWIIFISTFIYWLWEVACQHLIAWFSGEHSMIRCSCPHVEL